MSFKIYSTASRPIFLQLIARPINMGSSYPISYQYQFHDGCEGLFGLLSNTNVTLLKFNNNSYHNASINAKANWMHVAKCNRSLRRYNDIKLALKGNCKHCSLNIYSVRICTWKGNWSKLDMESKKTTARSMYAAVWTVVMHCIHVRYKIHHNAAIIDIHYNTKPTLIGLLLLYFH